MSGLSGLFGGGTATSNAPSFMGLRVQTSAPTLPIPIVWGTTRVGMNIGWFQGPYIGPNATGGKQQGGFFGSLFGGSNTPTYWCSIVMLLCEGPIIGVGQVWRDDSVWSLGGLLLGLMSGTTPETPWDYLTGGLQYGFQGTAKLICGGAPAGYLLGQGVTSLGNHNFEVFGLQYGTGFNGADADPALIVNDFLTSAQFGCGFPSAAIDTTTLFGSGGDASVQTYCKAVGLALSPCLDSQDKASDILQRWMQLTNTAAVWSGAQLRFIPYGDTATIEGTAQTITELRQIPLQPAQGNGSTPALPTIQVSFFPTFSADSGVVFQGYGLGTALTKVADPTLITTIDQYAESGGVYTFAAGAQSLVVEISYGYTTPASYTPNLIPVYALTDDDLVIGNGAGGDSTSGNNDADAVEVERTDQYEAYNIWRMEVRDRNNAYNVAPLESRDQAAIEAYGERIASTVSGHDICDPNVGAQALELMKLRAVNIRKRYKFKLGWAFCLLDPMDVVTLTSLSGGGLSGELVRITEIAEDADGLLAVSAEEFPVGTATAAFYPLGSSAGNPINQGTIADPVNTPIIFEPGSALLASSGSATPQLWFAVSGGAAGVADPNWGGALVWLSLDGTTYTDNIGTIVSPARMGVLTAALPAFSGTNPDTADTLAVNVAESGATLAGGSASDAALGNKLCIADGELLSFETATLTGSENYSLGTLYRGLYGTAAGAHAIGAPFARLDGAIFKVALPAQYAGQELYFKFQSFNIFGLGYQDISACTAYTYRPAGTGVDHPIARAWMTGAPMDLGSITDAVGAADDFGASLALAVELDVDLGAI
jgi:hypothetical protein